jgi:hypothetical protein
MITFLDLGRYGQIGNQMFQIAGTIGIARRFGYHYAFPEWINHDGVGKGNMAAEDANIGEWFAQPLARLSASDARRMERFSVPWGYHPSIHIRDWSDLHGHMQSEKWFAHCAQEIRDTFTFATPPTRVNKCAVHVRGGDYDGRYHNRLTEKYYHESMQIMQQLGMSKFTVFSDDPDFAKSVTGMDAINIPDPMNAMRMMSGYAAVITANSSFSWWAAWLSAAEQVIAPSQWVGDLARLDTSDIVPERWRIVTP